MVHEEYRNNYLLSHQDGFWSDEVRYKVYQANQSHFDASITGYKNELFTVGGLYQIPNASILEWNGTEYSFVTRDAYPYAQS